jgi:hypothetical protein
VPRGGRRLDSAALHAYTQQMRSTLPLLLKMRTVLIPHGAACAVLLAMTTLTGAALVAPDRAAAQCTARVQTGSNPNLAALAARCGTTVGDIRRANPGRNLQGGALLNMPGGAVSVVPNTLNNSVAPSPRPLAPIRQAPPIRMPRN